MTTSQFPRDGAGEGDQPRHAPARALGPAPTTGNPEQAQAPSLLDGGPAPALELSGLGDALVRAARAQDSGTLCWVGSGGRTETFGYPRLLGDARRMLAALRAAGAVPGEKIILQIGDAPQALAAFWACVLGGFLPLPVAAHKGAEGSGEAADLLHRVWCGYGRPRVITGEGQEIAPATAADPRWSAAGLGEAGALLAHPPDRAHHRPDLDDPALLLLTSGSTGVPKAVVLSHRNMLSRSAADIRSNGLSRASRTVNWMPLDHVGGLVMFHVRDVVLGCHQVHVRTDRVLQDPLRWLEVIDQHRADTTWAPGFAFRLVTEQAARLHGRRWDLSCLRAVMNGGEPVRAPVVRAFLGLLAPYGLPRTAMRPGWGMSETSGGVADCEFTAAAAAGAERYVSVGRPQPGTAVRVVDGADAVVEQGTTGRLQVTGASVTGGYHGRRRNDRRDFTPDGWLRTGDLGFVRDGLLTVTGRADDTIRLGGATYHGHEIEAAVEQLGCVEPTFTVAGPVGAPGGEELAVFFHPRSGDTAPEDAAEAVRAHIRRCFGAEVRHVVPVGREDVPKTGIGKLRRARMRQRFERDQADNGGSSMAPASTPPPSARQAQPASTIDFWFDYTCPFSLLARHVVAEATEGTRARMVWHPFELRPEGLAGPAFSQEVWENAVLPLARRVGVEIDSRPPAPVPVTRLAFQGLQYALESGSEDGYCDSVFSAYFAEHQDIADIATLTDIAREAGLDPEDFRSQAVSLRLADRHRAALERSEAAVKIIPTMVVGARRIEGVPSREQIARLVGD
ncbi:AMP-binding protein [Streptomyces sp. N2-109]|uniref:AMP-binding protein n=1 Tax=Streptomyces gossypii TaxID=2883101 RepID=A0ABT2K3J5_9ACTN|nr:AMP-binding protein [Streptomyces gossypii]MCT2594728.1 AMP-binding protein [Streptomyces gossypii]